ncbi:Major facilitator superfamily [Nannochloropsis gaditana]|uniref:Major facilitator superfamily n=1 Tax=Nannochloropsis gaditana TaxID=72520 RepID=W7TBJ7_9STRA|nr:Major facilitator superfamily [Nannochloropsis gaditana]
MEPTPVTAILPRGDRTFQGRPTLFQGVRYVLSSPRLVRLILVLSLTSFLNGGLFLSVKLLTLHSEGFDMQPRESSTILLLFGCWAMAFNACLFRPLVRRLGPKRANMLGLLGTSLGVLVLPLADAFVEARTWALWTCTVASVLVFASSYMLVNSLLVGFISAHASPSMQGITQGLAVSLSSSLSGLEPVVLGSVANAAQEARLPVLTFLFLTCGYLVSFLALRGVPRAALEGECNLLNVEGVDFPPIRLDEITIVCKECLYFKKWLQFKADE